VPNVESLNLQTAGVDVGKEGILVNSKLQTSNPKIYAAGDVIGGYLFTHVAGYEGAVAMQNALVLPTKKADYRVIPWATFTDPELARVGLTEEQARKRYGDDLMVLRHDFDHVDRALAEGAGIGFAKFITRKNGEIFDARLVMTRVSDADGHFSGAVTVIRDVSAEKRLAAQKARFIATASHELRTPITNMKTRLYLIGKQPDKTQEHLRVMNKVTNRMKKLVEDLLDLSRFENGVITLDLCKLPLRSLVDGVVETQEAEAEKRQISLRANVLAYQLLVEVDESRMMQVLTNLVTNAINYTPDGGAVEVSMDAAPGGPAAPHGWAIINVTDTGIGIAPDQLPDVFQPFFRANDFNPGMGLGLSITREIIAQHNGHISVDSTLNEGTTFTVKLPLISPPGIDEMD